MKKYFSIVIGTILVLLFTFQACIDKDYDDINKEAIFKLPSIPLGSFDTTYVHTLPAIDGGIGTSFRTLTVTDTVYNLFDESTIDKFFYEGAGNVELSGEATAMFTQMPSAELTLRFDIIDIIEGKEIKNNNVSIISQTIKTGENQPISIAIKKEDIQYMKNARNLMITIRIDVKAPEYIKFDTKKDYLSINKVMVKTEGLFFEI